MRVDQQHLIDAIQAIDLVPSRGGIVPSEFVQLEKVKDTIYFSMASEVFGRTYCKIKEQDKQKDWVFWLDRTSFIPFITVASSMRHPKDFEFEILEKKNNQRLIIRHGRRKVIFNAISNPIEGYSVLNGKSKSELKLNDHQKSLLTLASKYATNDPTLAHVNCVYLHKGKSILSSNRTVLFRAKDKIVPESVPFPLMLLNLFNSDKAKSVSTTGKLVKIDMGCGYICQPVNEKAVNDFPLESFNKQLEKGAKNDIQFSVKAKSLVTAMKRLETYVSTVINREITVEVFGIKGSRKLKLKCNTPQGKFEETVLCIDRPKIDLHCEWLLDSITPLVDFLDSLSILNVRYNDKKKTAYHVSTKEGLELLLTRRM